MIEDWRGERKPNDGIYPIIWKTEGCFSGECMGSFAKHRWGVPLTVPGGLMTECFDCHKTREIKTCSNSDPEFWVNKLPSPEWVVKRLKELKR